MKKRFVFFVSFLVTLFSFCFVPVSASVSGDYTYTVSGTNATITGFTKSVSGSVTIPSTLDGYTVTTIAASAFSNCTNLTSVVVPDSVTSIGDSAFKGCTALTNITLPFVGNIGTASGTTSSVFGYIFGATSSSTVAGTTRQIYSPSGSTSYDNYYYIPSSLRTVTITKATQIPAGAFSNCSNLTRIILPDTVTVINNYAFYNCTSATTITTPGNESSTAIIIPQAVTNIGDYAFYHCDKTTNLSMTDNVKTIGANAFQYCINLANVKLSTQLQVINPYSFASCSALPTIDLPETVTKIGTYAFAWCSELKNITTPQAVTAVDSYAFYGCSKLATVTFNNRILSIGDYAFQNCAALTSVTIPDSVTSIGLGTFKGCAGLTEITLPFVGQTAINNNTTSSVFGYIFGSSSISAAGTTSQIYSPSGSTSYDNYYYIPSSLRTVTITKATQIPTGAFSNCGNLTRITLPDTVTVINNYAFYYCSSATTITTPGNESSTAIIIPQAVTSIGDYAFYHCDKPTSLSMTDNVKTIGANAFQYCSNLKSVKLPTQLQAISSYSFASCSALPTIAIPETVTKIGTYAFAWCSELKNIITPQAVTAVDSYAFYGCSKLATVTFNNRILSIGDYAFQNCAALTSVTIPDSVTSIGLGTFQGCSGLTEITLPFVGATASSNNTVSSVFGYIFGSSSISAAGTTSQIYSPSGSSSYDNYYFIPSGLRTVTVTKATQIPTGAFSNCSSLTSITLPDTVTVINNYAFYYCTSVTTIKTPGNEISTAIIIPQAVTSIGNYAFFSCSKITNLSMSDNVQTIGTNAFQSCANLKNAKLSTQLQTISPYLFYACNTLSTVAIPETVTRIGTYAFGVCSQLKNITIPQAVTAVDSYAFYYCPKLTSVIMNNGILSIGDYAFKDCAALTSVTIPDSVTSIGSSTFLGCSGLTEITLPFIGNTGTTSGSSSSVFGYIFGQTISNTAGYVSQQYSSSSSTYCYAPSALKTVNITKATQIPYGAFYNYNQITSIQIPKTVVSAGSNAFYNTKWLSSQTDDFLIIGDGVLIRGKDTNNAINIPSGVKYIADAFRTMRSGATISINVPDGTRTIGADAFTGLSHTTVNISIPYSVTSIADGIFYMNNRVKIKCYNNSAALAYAKRNSISYELLDSEEKIGLDSYSYIISNGKAEITSCKTTSTNITLPGTLGGAVVEKVGTGAFRGASTVTAIAIPNNIKAIGDYAFADCKGIVDVTIPGTVASLGKNSFAECSNLKNVTIKDGITRIGDYSFYNCKALTEVNIPDSVTAFGDYAFYGCDNLESATIGTSATGVGNYAFGNCPKLSTAVIGSAATTIGEGAFINSALQTVTVPSGVVSIGDKAFQNNQKLTRTTVRAGLIQIGSATFKDCVLLSQITIPATVTSLGSGAFSGCASLKTITIPNGVAEISDSVFDSCITLNTVNLGTGVTKIGNNAFRKSPMATITFPSVLVSIGDGAFRGCANLSEIVTPDSTTSIGSLAFFECSSLKNLSISDNMTQIGTGAFDKCGVLAAKIRYASGTIKNNLFLAQQIRTVEIGDGIYSIGDYAFSRCLLLTDVFLSNDVRAIGAYAFNESEKLNIISMSDLMQTIGTNAFDKCNNITILVRLANGAIADDLFSGKSNTIYSGQQMSAVVLENGMKSIGKNAFYNCSAMKDLTMPDSVKSIGHNAFIGCKSVNVLLKYVDGVIADKLFAIDGEANRGQNIAVVTLEDGITTIGDSSFYGCVDLVKINMSKTLDRIGQKAFYTCKALTDAWAPSVSFIGSYAFYDCNSLKKTIISDKIQDILEYTFYGCASLSDVTIPSSVRTIGQYAFYACTGLTGVNLSASKALNTIDAYAFYNCNKLTEILFPSSMKTIGTYAFRSCGFTDITIPDGMTSVGDGAFYGCAKLKSANIGYNITKLPERVFYGCVNLLDIFLYGNVTSIGQLTFYGCEDLTIYSVENQYVRDFADENWLTFKLISNDFDVEVTPPSKLSYTEGEQLDTTGMIVAIKYNDGTTQNITEGYKVTGFDTNVFGAQTVCIEYRGIKKYFDVVVSKKGIRELTLVPPDKTDYLVGEALDLSGMVLTAVYADDTSRVIASDYTVTGYNQTTAGSQTISVTYDGKVATFAVKVMPIEVSLLEVLQAKRTYAFGEELDLQSIVLKATYNNGSSSEIRNEFTVSGYVKEQAGAQDLTVTYSGKTTILRVTVAEKVMTGLTLLGAPEQTVYAYGEEINLQGLTLKATYNNGSTENITAGYTFTGYDAKTVGTQTITVAYAGKTVTFTVTVNTRALSAVTVKTAPTKTTYTFGEALDLSGLVLKALYDDGSNESITDGFVVSGYDKNKAGTQTITLTYGGKTTTVEVSVADRMVSLVTIQTQPSKLVYQYGEPLDLTGLSLQVRYNNGDTEIISTGFEVKGYNPLDSDTQTLTVTYGGKSAKFTVLVGYRQIISLKVNEYPYRQTFGLGEDLDLAGLVIGIIFNNGSEDVTSSGFSISGYDKNKLGTQVVTLTFGGKTVTLSVSVVDVVAQETLIRTRPTKLSYWLGEALDPSGMTVEVFYYNGTSEIISTGFELTGYDPNTVGTQRITMHYGGKTDSFGVQVQQRQISELKFNSYPTKLSYVVGSDLDLTGLVLGVTYSSGDVVSVSSGIDASGYDKNKTGSQLITLTYGGKTITFSVSVVARAVTQVTVQTAPTKVQYQFGEALDLTGLSLQLSYNNSDTEVISTGFAVTGYDPTASGTQTITVTYAEKSATFTVEVLPKQVTALQINSYPTKLSYVVGSYLDLAGLVLGVTYSNGEIVNVSTDIGVSGYDENKIGSQLITLTYGGKTTTFSVSVVAKTVTQVYVQTSPTKVQYQFGEALDLTGFSLQLRYNNGDTDVISTGFDVTGYDPTTPGTQTIIVTYAGESANFTVTVGQRQVTALKIDSYPDRQTFAKGEDIDWRGLTLGVTYNDGSQDSIATGFDVSNYDKNTIGSQLVTLAYGSKTVTISISVVDILAKDTIIQTHPTKLLYWAGEALDPTGMTVKINYYNGTSEIISTGFELTGYDANKAGTQTITVHYGGKSDAFTVEVKQKQIVGLWFISYPKQLTYVVGSDLDLTGLVLGVYYSDASETSVSTDIGISGYDKNKVGTQLITLTYGGQSKTLSVSVIDNVVYDVTVQTYPTKTEYQFGEAFDRTGLTLCEFYADGTSKIITTGFTVTGYDPNKAGSQTLTANYLGYSVPFSIYVHPAAEKVTTQIKIETLPTKLAYKVNEAIDVSGMVVNATYSDGSTAQVSTTNCTLTGYDSSKTGVQIITVTSGGKTDTFSILVFEEKAIEASHAYSIRYVAPIGAKGEILDDIPSTETINVSVNFAQRDAENTAFVIVAVYGSKDELLSIVYKNTSQCVNGTFDASLNLKPGQVAHHVKAFVWNDLTSMKATANVGSFYKKS